VRVKLEELQAKVGEVVGTSDWYAIPQERIDRFAAATEDFQFIHVDPARAADTPFGQTIAHGFLTLSMLPVLRETSCPEPEVAMSVNYGLNRLRFLAPVRSGQRIRGIFTLTDLTEKRPGQWQQAMEVTVEIEGEEKPALVTDWIFQHFA
jgi:acyl dehydratase